jgi:uncharacterized protein (TIGR00645 family)
MADALDPLSPEPVPPPFRRALERRIEAVMFFSRWIMVPFYFGLLLALVVLFGKFAVEVFHFVTHAVSMTESNVVLGILTLIDLCLLASLILIVVFSGYENFVSKIDGTEHGNWPEWMRDIDFSGLKQKLLASIVAISAIHLLKAFMDAEKGPPGQSIYWLIIIHVVFVGSSLVLALSDRISSDAKYGSAGKDAAKAP